MDWQVYHKESREVPLCLSPGHPKRKRSLKMYYVIMPQGKKNKNKKMFPLTHISHDVYVIWEQHMVPHNYI